MAKKKKRGKKGKRRKRGTKAQQEASALGQRISEMASQGYEKVLPAPTPGGHTRNKPVRYREFVRYPAPLRQNNSRGISARQEKEEKLLNKVFRLLMIVLCTVVSGAYIAFIIAGLIDLTFK